LGLLNEMDVSLTYLPIVFNKLSTPNFKCTKID
jgi:hypothetical protein